MPQALSRVFLHIVFSTKYRQNLIDEDIEDRLFSYIGKLCKGINCLPIQVGGYQNHIHILCSLSREVTQSELLRQIKQYSSKWIKTIDPKYSNFYWQRGYGIFSVHYNNVEIVKRYILRQKEHHQSLNFKKEYLKILAENNAEYDERYVWE